MRKSRKIDSKIVVALIIILLCIVSLVGVTFALFTNGDDGIIGINVTSGDIKIDIVDKNLATMVGDTLSFADYEGDPNEIWWEPGAIRYTEPFAIQNLGNIPVSYRVYIECKDEDAKLLEVLEFYIISETDLKKAGGRVGLEMLDEDKKMTSFDKKLAENAISDEYYHLVVRMLPSAGNDYQGLLLNGVGITVYAVQGNVDISDTVTESTTESVTESVTETQTESESVNVTETETETTAETESET